ncbi:permease-like cell division protein FtsX [Dokdonella sp.]|uniref:permease-like cell division protein FtsX n=1 Tax=Dokdonella sp. TaxID=2291710 RepID=UPI0025C1A99A|nr:permease-like cell division protein FtsX [Dokdonella sp.]MBX3691050.1 permease-like cell division protein FtsX [Dokdonella sp.]
MAKSERIGGNRLRPAPAANVSVRRARRPLGTRFEGWRQAHQDAFGGCLQRFATRPWASLVTILVIGIALALPLLFHVILDNARQLSGGLRDARDVTVFLKIDVDAARAAAFAAELGQRHDVERIVVRTPDEGLAEFRQLSGFNEALDVLQHNPLPSVLVVTPRSASDDPDHASLLDTLRNDARAGMVQYDAAWRKRLSALLGFGERAMLALMALLAVATLLIIGNTVRMDIQGKSEEIAVLQLIGASNAFVRRPFLYTGVAYGLLGGALALLAVGLVEWAVAAPAADLLESYRNRFRLAGFGAREALAVLGGGAVLGWLGAWLVSSGHLRAGRIGESRA